MYFIVHSSALIISLDVHEAVEGGGNPVLGHHNFVLFNISDCKMNCNLFGKFANTNNHDL